MASFTSLSLLLCISLFLSYSLAEDDTITYNFEVSYITASPLGVPQQVYNHFSKFLSVCTFVYMLMCVYILYFVELGLLNFQENQMG